MTKDFSEKISAKTVVVAFIVLIIFTYSFFKFKNLIYGPEITLFSPQDGSSLKNELISVPQVEIVALGEKDIEGALEGFKRRLEEAELIELSEQAPLVKALVGRVDSVALSQWNHAIDALDYARALKIMKTWEIHEGKIC